jgi:ubiquinone/menaquinone biosynthesis C-methylase UbiE
LQSNKTPKNTFKNVSIKSIKTKKANVKGLIASITEFGLMTPILFDKNGERINGDRRIHAAQIVGLETVPACYLTVDGKAAQIARIEQELVKNEPTVLRRAEILMEWYDTGKGWLFEPNGGIKTGQSAKLSFCEHVGNRMRIDKRSIYRQLAIARGLSPELRQKMVNATGVPNRKKLSQQYPDKAEFDKALSKARSLQWEAIKILDDQTTLSLLAGFTKKGKSAEKCYDKLLDHPGWSVGQADAAVQQEQGDKPSGLSPKGKAYEFMLGDVLDRMAEIKDEQIDVILSDIPWHNDLIPLYEKLVKEIVRVTKPDGHILLEMGQMFSSALTTVLDKHLFRYWELCIYHGTKSEGPVNGRKVQSHWTPMLWYTKAKGLHAFDKNTIPDYIVGGEKDKRFHPYGQPLKEFDEVVKAIPKPGNLVLDMFCGGGTTMIACLKNKCRCIGIDKSEKYINRAEWRVKHFLKYGHDEGKLEDWLADAELKSM